MTREEAITVLKAFMKNPLFSEVHKVAFNIAIHDIKAYHDWSINNLILINKKNYETAEQEPKSEWEQDHAILKAYSDGANEVLDKIRAEIKQYQSDYDVHGTEYDRTAWKAFNRCLQSIDKYKAETRDKYGRYRVSN